MHTKILITSILFLCQMNLFGQDNQVYFGNFNSTASSYRGSLKLTASELADGIWQGQFNVTFGSNKYKYPATFISEIIDNKNTFSGKITIGQTEYKWQGIINKKLMKGTYIACSETGQSDEKGEFTLKKL